MIKYYDGTVFNTPAHTLVNTVNCFGVMGAGIALEFKLRYPEMYEEYKQRCNKKEYKIGRPRLYKSSEKWVLNFPTKNHWRYPSKIEWIEEGLQYFASNYKKAGIESIAFPKLGTSNGGLEWTDVKKIMEKYLGDLDIDVYICLDESKEAEGIELLMIEEINKINIDRLIKDIKITKKQAESVVGSLPVKRFWTLSKAKGLGEKTYEKIFSYFYNRFAEKNESINKNDIDLEQITFFS